MDPKPAEASGNPPRPALQGYYKRLGLDWAARATYSVPPMLLHITPLEAPIVWFAFAAGAACGCLATLVVLRRKQRAE